MFNFLGQTSVSFFSDCQPHTFAAWQRYPLLVAFPNDEHIAHPSGKLMAFGIFHMHNVKRA